MARHEQRGQEHEQPRRRIVLPGAAPSRARPKAKDEDEFSAGVIVVVYASEKRSDHVSSVPQTF